MTTPHFPDDWEILSAYLDGQLSSREMDKVRLRLEAQPDLQRALDELQRTRMVLRAAPRRRAPRNFTLSPDMVPQRRSWSWLRPTPVFSFASGLAVILLVVSFIFTSLPGLNPTTNLLAGAPVTSQSTKGFDVTTPLANDQSSGQPPIIAWGGGPGLGGGSGGGGPASSPPGAGGIGGGPGIVETQPTLEPNATPPVPEVTQPQPPAASSTAQETPEATTVAAAPPRNAAPSQDNGPILGIRPQAEQGVIEITPESGQSLTYAAPGASPAPGQEQPYGMRNLGAIQIGLGLLAVGFALAAILLRRKS